jgi:hypothetical protein
MDYLEMSYLPGMMAHAYNPTYLGGRDWEDHGLGPVWRKVQETPSQPIKS